MENFSLAPNVETHASHIGGEPVYVYANDLSGEHFAVNQKTHRILQKILSGHEPKRLRNESPEAFAEFSKVLPLLFQNGLLRNKEGQRYGSAASSARKKSIEQKVLFARIEFFEIGSQFDFLAPLAKWLFSKSGVLTYCLSTVVALGSIVANTDIWLANIQRAEATSTLFVFGLAFAFLFTKFIHELGHALTTRSRFLLSGQSPPIICAGVATFFFFPFPFTNTTASWRLKSKWDRVRIAVAGMYFETWLALICIFIMNSINEGDLQFFLFQLVVVTGVSTLLFNLNPLIRLDGYYIATDICDAPNLATRASQEVRALIVAFLFGERTNNKRNPRIIIYGIAAYLYRISMFAAIFILAFTMAEALGIAVLLAGLSVLVVRPLIEIWTTFQKSDEPNVRKRFLMRSSMAICGMLLILLVPLPMYKCFEGHLSYLNHQHVYLEGTGWLALAPARGGQANAGIVAQLHNPELSFQRQGAQAKLRLAELKQRQHLSLGAEHQDEVMQALQSARDELNELERQTEQLVVSAATHEIWHPHSHRQWDGTWQSPTSREKVGVLLPSDGFEAVVQIPSDEVMFDIKEIEKQIFDVRISGTWQDSIKARVRRVTRTASSSGQADHSSETPRATPAGSVPSFEVRLSLPKDRVPHSVTLQGKHLTARLFNGYHPIGIRLSNWLMRLRQKRIQLSGS